ncbi:MAG: cell division protein ZapA [Syntrophales bacterium]|nr:cell division protein ZapA [Syntrophales bacterium]
MSKKRFCIEILGQALEVVSDAEEDHVRKVVDLVNAKAEDLKYKTFVWDTLNLAILIALNIADDYLKLKAEKEDTIHTVERRSKQLIDLIDHSL